ncbi:MAG: hypothetical protein IPJ00_19125 [Saprospirales bacterium]|nr:hypothetical protein [Saprospirales bacterium]
MYHEWRYYVLNDPVVNDFEYDSLFKQLQNLETHYPGLASPDSPTQRRSADLTEVSLRGVPQSNSFRWPIPMMQDDLVGEFDEQVKKLTMSPVDAGLECVVEPKYDGGTIATGL